MNDNVFNKYFEVLYKQAVQGGNQLPRTQTDEEILSILINEAQTSFLLAELVSRPLAEYNDPLRKIHRVIVHNPEAGAEVRLLNEHEIEISFSIGLFWAITDLALRAVSCDNFFSDKEKQVFQKSCRCYILNELLVGPQVRYVDYSVFDVMRGLLGEKNSANFSAGQTLSIFAKKIPLDDKRLDIATEVVQMAVLWIFLHEEAHYRQGHLQFIEENKVELDLGLSGRKKSNSNPDQECDFGKLFEFEADQYATDFFYGLLLEKREIQLLKGEITQDEYNRHFLFVARCSFVAIFFLDRIRRSKGESLMYPSIHTRFMTVVGGLYWKGTSRGLDGERNSQETFEAFWERASTLREFGRFCADLVYYVNKEEGNGFTEDCHEFLPVDPPSCILLVLLIILPEELRHEVAQNKDVYTEIVGGEVKDVNSVMKRSKEVSEEYNYLKDLSLREVKPKTKKYREKASVDLGSV